MSGSPFTKGSTTLAGFNQGEGNIGYAPAPWSLAKAGLNFAQGQTMKRSNWEDTRIAAYEEARKAAQAARLGAASKPWIKKTASAAARRSRRSRRTRRTRRSRR